MPTITQSRSVAPRPTDWSGSVTLDQTDPASGVTNLTLSLTGNLYSSVAIENLEASAASFGASDTGSLTLSRPDGTARLTATPATSLVGTLTAYDGTTDGAGSSGAVLRASSAQAVVPNSGSIPYTPVSDAALLLGTGTVTLPVTATARVDAIAPGNFTAEFASDIAATVSTIASPIASLTPVPLEEGVILQEAHTNLLFDQFNAGIQARQQVVTIAQAATGTNNTVTLAGLDPTLGTLVGVDIDLLAYANGTAAVENLDPVAGILGISQAANIALTRTDGTSLVSAAAPGLSLTTILAGADGHMDFAGASGADLALQAASPGTRTALTLSNIGASVLADRGTNDTLFTDASTLSAFTGAGAITLDANRSGVTALSGPGNLAIDTTLQTGGAAIVTYLYTPAGP